MANLLSNRATRRVARTVRRVDRMPRQLGRRPPEHVAGTRRVRWWKLTGSALQAGFEARWNYAFTEQQLKADGTGFEARPDGLTGTTGTDPARNSIELAHIVKPAGSTAWYVWGVDVHNSPHYPTGFAPLPVGGGGTSGTHKVDIIVPGWLDGAGRAWFAAVGSHDGSCS